MVFLYYNVYMDNTELNQIIGKNVKKYRLLYNINIGKMTQENLAEAVNCSVSLISSLESNNINKGVSLLTLFNISVVLKTPINKFFEDNTNS